MQLSAKVHFGMKSAMNISSRKYMIKDVNLEELK